MPILNNGFNSANILPHAFNLKLAMTYSEKNGYNDYIYFK